MFTLCFLSRDYDSPNSSISITPFVILLLSVMNRLADFEIAIFECEVAASRDDGEKRRDVDCASVSRDKLRIMMVPV